MLAAILITAAFAYVFFKDEVQEAPDAFGKSPVGKKELERRRLEAEEDEEE